MLGSDLRPGTVAIYVSDSTIIIELVLAVEDASKNSVCATILSVFDYAEQVAVDREFFDKDRQYYTAGWAFIK